MKSSVHLYLESFINNGKYLFYKDEKDFVVMPAIGDIVEFGDKTRTIVIYSDITTDASGDANIEVYTLENDFEMLLNKRGRQRRSLAASPKDAEWPMPNASLIRDGKIIYPVNFKFRAINNFYILLGALKEKLSGVRARLLVLKEALRSLKEKALFWLK
tara:strand:+ start:8731 stop:9207 length:477 start_codon:yes stop_codon:yes gene_type:complete